MHALVIVTLFSIAVVDYLAASAAAPAILKFVPELLSVVVALYVVFEGVRKRFQYVSAKYWIVFGCMTLIILCGILTNGVGTGPTVAGIRAYVRAIPMFLLPAVCAFSDKQKMQQLKLLVGIGLLQVPFAAYQRYIVWSEGRFSGDSVSGTLLHSGALSVTLICIVLVLAGFSLRKQVGRVTFLVLFFTLLLPTMINETKATVVLLPLGLLTTLVIGSPPGKRVRVVVWAMLLLAAFAAVLIPVYDFTQEHNPYHNSLVGFFTNEKQLGGYMEAKNAGIGATHQVGRSDAVLIPAQYLAHDPVRLAFGLGLGNASHSSLGQNFIGQYYGLFQSFVITSFTVFMLEIGVLGTALVFLLYWLVFSDALYVARRDDSMVGSVAIGWTGVVVVMSIATFYMTTHAFNSLAFLYWYFSGMVAARRTQMVMAQQQVVAGALAGRVGRRVIDSRR
jgi:hypothetical protein